jgi:hypothetical protein
VKNELADLIEAARTRHPLPSIRRAAPDPAGLRKAPISVRFVASRGLIAPTPAGLAADLIADPTTRWWIAPEVLAALRSAAEGGGDPKLNMEGPTNG